LELSGEPVAVADNVLNFPSEVGPTANSTVSVSDNGRMIYLIGGKQMTEFSWFDRNGKLLETINQPGRYHEPAESPDGKRVVYGQSGDLAMFEFGRGASSRFTFDPGEEMSPIWTPDGARVVFASDQKGNIKLFQKPASGAAGEELLLDTPRNAFPDSVSPDGKYLIYELDGGPEKKFDLWMLPLFGDRTPQPYLSTSFVESHAAFSPDGRWVAYTSDESGRTEVFVQSFPASGGKWQVSIAGGDQPMWSSDGKELYYIAPDRNLMSVAINPGTTFDAGKPAVLFQTHVPVTGLTDDRNNYLPSSDGQRFLVNHLVDEGNTQPIVVVLNWPADIKK
jgi:Tol biopolymer transport system component